ncbi:3-octaprenyl-4-hydroxybenzoate carboxy-lyase [Bacillus sp. TS-2]|nr:3-octaprenyl-4-hydroxybenzoate carboxy-lyase [Bacillus sp. TS-2]
MYKNLEECILDLEKEGHLIRIKEEVDPYLEMAALQLRVYAEKGPALYFEKVKGSKYPAVSNLFGTVERSKFIFRKTMAKTQSVIGVRNNPSVVLKNPFKYLDSGFAAINALPQKKKQLPSSFKEIQITDLPQIKSWPDDGGAFITLPQVYSEDPDKPGIMNSNLGMYRVQLDGNDYIENEEVGLHYQIHRGIGVHQAKAVKKGEALKVSIFIGGHPAHTLSAVMPLPEGMSELTFAGLLAGRRFRYSYEDGFCVSHDADFVITGEIYPDETKLEGPFGDHLGYYSLAHEFPVMKVHKVYAKDNAIWPFTVVGRPPQEDTSFGDLIHELTGGAVQAEIPGVKEVHAVDAAGVHPLLLAIGYERYTPYQKLKQPQEILTIANRILGTSHLSLAKYLFIAAEEDVILSTHKQVEFFTYLLERIDLQRDIHLQTNTTIDTLDYTGTGMNQGSKVIFAAAGEKKRELCLQLPSEFLQIEEIQRAHFVLPGIIAIEMKSFMNYDDSMNEMNQLASKLAKLPNMSSCPLLVVCDDSSFTSESISNFQWVTFTRSNPATDMYGVSETFQFKHWGCDQLIIDARRKPHHAPPLIADQKVVEYIERFYENESLKTN